MTASIEWTTELLDAAQAIFEVGRRNGQRYTYEYVAREISRRYRQQLYGAEVSGEALRSALRRMNARNAFAERPSFAEEVRATPIPVSRPYHSKYSDAFTRSPARKETDTPLEIGADADILVLPDIHFSLHDPDALQMALDLGSEADVAVVSGDLLDLYAFSKFEKYHSGSLEEEMEHAIWLLEILSRTKRRVLLMSGNHEDRMKKTIGSKLPAEFQFLANCSDILEYLARPFPNVHAVTDTWYIQLNDAVICHAPVSKSGEIQSVKRIHEFLTNWQFRLNLKPHRVVVQSHIHRLGEYIFGDTKLMEAGCLCRSSDYRERSMITTPETQGFITLSQRSGMSIQNHCRTWRA